MSPQKMNEEEKAVGIGCCRICLISRVNCVNCRFAFALPLINIENEWYSDVIFTNVTEIAINIELWN